MRMVDKRDIIMLCYEAPNIKKLVDHLNHSPKEKIIEHINELASLLNDSNLKDSLKGVYSINDKLYTKAIQNCLRILDNIKDKLF